MTEKGELSEEQFDALRCLVNLARNGVRSKTRLILEAGREGYSKADIQAAWDYWAKSK